MQILETLHRFLTTGDQYVIHDSWILVNRTAREQGWKLHISATILSAPTVLARVVPILLTARAPFKVIKSIGCLAELNGGVGGYGQVGKFITVYPEDDTQAVRLACDLDQATEGLNGPRIPTDRPIQSDSLVHYRYGGFGNTTMIDSLGQVLPALRDLSGSLVADVRGPTFSPPSWAQDPFEEAGIVAREEPVPQSPLFAGYLILSVLNQNAKGGVYLALDPSYVPPRMCVLKEARRHVGTGPCGRDIRDRLRYQYTILKELEEDAAFPDVYDIFECDGNCYMSMQFLDGETLQELVTSQMSNGKYLSAVTIVDMGAQIAAIVGRMHQRGWTWRDLTPTNVMVLGDKVHVIDLELLYSDGDSKPSYGWGTPGYTSPQQAKRQRMPSSADDIYSLGATLYFLATGADPSFLAQETGSVRNALKLIRPALPDTLVSLIERCMSDDPAARPQDVDSVVAELASPSPGRRSGNGQNIAGERADSRSAYLDFARGIGEYLLETADHQAPGICWASTAASQSDQQRGQAFHLPRSQTYSWNLHNGVSGIALFLADLADVTQHSSYLDAAEAAARWLLRVYETNKPMLPGLHFGEAGIAAFLCRLSEVTGDGSHLERASSMALGIASSRTEIPDLTHGWAGIGLLHLRLVQAGATSQHLALAQGAGDLLLSHAERVGSGVGWRQPDGPHVGMSNEVLSGLAHGIAGITYFLLELWKMTDDVRYFDAVRAATCCLSDYAKPSLDDESGVNWPLALGGKDDADRWFYWCHGAAGIGLFLLRASTLTDEEDYKRLATRAARTVAVAGRRGGGTLCHGLAGNGSMLLESYRVLGDSSWLNAAYDFGELLQLYSRQTDNGRIWPAEEPSAFTPDLMVGCAGVGRFFLGLALPERCGSSPRIPVI